HAVPPPPAPTSSPPASRVRPKLNIANASRYPQAIPVQPSEQSLPMRPPPMNSPRRPAPNRKGLLVRFVDTWPEIIGEGGDECPEPTIEVSKRKKARPPPSPRPPPHQSPMMGRSPTRAAHVARAGDGVPSQSPQLLQASHAERTDSGLEEQGTISPGNARMSR